MGKVELLLKPVNDGKNTLPMVKVDDQVFAYLNESLNTYPAKALPYCDTCTTLGTARMTAEPQIAAIAYQLCETTFKTFDAIKADPVKFALEFTALLLGKVVKENTIWKQLENQEWDESIDATDIFKRSSSASSSVVGRLGRSSFQSSTRSSCTIS